MKIVKQRTEAQLQASRERAKTINHKRRSDPEYRMAESKKNCARAMKYRTDIIEMLGDKCVRCGFTDVRALQLDHINGGGTKEFRAFNNSTSSWHYHYLKHPEEAKVKLQVLCANCNWIKRAENNEVSLGMGRPPTKR